MDKSHYKEYAAYSNINESPEWESSITNNLIHESGRIELNTYQTFVKNLMNPQSDLRSLMLVHMTGTGKTITALATATEYVRQYSQSNQSQSVSSVIVLGFTKDIFKRELLSHPEFEFVNMDEVKHMKELELHMHDSEAIAEQYQNKRKQYQRRLFKREVKGIYQFYGYRQFANRVINMSDVQTMISNQKDKEVKPDDEKDILDFDPAIIKKWIDAGDVRINTNFIKSLSKSLIICDEVHNLYKTNSLNTYGIAIQCVFDYFFKTLTPLDSEYGSVRSLLLSATPLTSSALEIIPITLLLTGETLNQNELFKVSEGVNQLTAVGASKIRHAISGKISYIMDDNPKEYPSSSFVGDSIKGINYIKFIRTTPVDHQLNFLQKWSYRLNSLSDEKGMNMVKDIVFPATKEFPHGVIFSKNVSDLDSLPKSLAVYKLENKTYSSPIFNIKQLEKYSCKYAKLVNLCMDMKEKEHGKIFIYHPFIQGSGVDLIISILNANGFVMDGDVPSGDSICMNCKSTYASHKNSKDHDFVPVHFTYITGSLSKSTVASRLNAFNSDLNVFGEKIKIIIGSKAMRESHTLKACRHIIIAHEPSSISEMIQIIGRAVRKYVHSMLPEDLRSVEIRVLSTNVSSLPSVKNESAANEELAYKIKVLQYDQINYIERIMYDVSIDYLINFRFKLRETPPLVGEAFPLDLSSYQKYEKDLTKAYSDLQNGITPSSIATNRFNVFYFSGEVKMVMMIIKRILLDHQPLVTIAQLRDLIRSPPFHVEYNTKLISDEAIVVAISKVSFHESHIRVVMDLNQQSLVDTLFDETSNLVDSDGRQYKIVCIGDPLCGESYVLRRLLSSILEKDNSVLDSFRKVYAPKFDIPIDMRDLSVKWASTIDLSDVIDDIKNEITSNPDSNLDSTLTRLPIETNVKLAEWAIKSAVDFVMKKKQTTDTDVIKRLVLFYQTKRVVFTISNLKHTKIYDRYKRLDVNTGTSWFNVGSKPSTGLLPIGHTLGVNVRIYQPSDSTWLELPSIGSGKESKHPYGFYIYEERIGSTMSVVLKVRFEKDVKAKGITMAFLQRTELQEIAKKLKADVSKVPSKPDMIEIIEKEASIIQLKIFPKRLLYRLIDM